MSWPSPPAQLLPERLDTERLIVRVARPGDGAMFRDAIEASLERLSPWLSWAQSPPTEAAAEAQCRRAHARYLLNEDLMAFFLLRDSGALVGGGGLHRVDWTLRQFEVGYWGHALHAGAGLVTEGVRALAEHALHELQATRVFLTTDHRNRDSWRLAERAGFELEGVLRNERLDLQGRLRDTRVYSRIAPQTAG